MAIIKKTISGLKPNTDYLFTLKPKNVEISATDIEQETIRVSVPAFDGSPANITGLQLASNFQSVIFKFDPVNDIDLSYYEYQLYDNENGNGSPINAVTSTANNSSEIQISGTNLANVFVVSVSNSTDVTTNQYWGRVRAVNTSGNPSTQWSNLVASGELALIEDSFIASLTAAKITAGTISGQAITLAGSNSVIKSSIYNPEDATPSGWYIQGDGSLSFGGPYGINYDPINGVTIGSSVVISPQTPIPDSSGVIFPGLTITTAVGTVGGIALGNDGYNYWLTNGKFRTGSLSKYLYWDPTLATPTLSIVGDIKNGSSLDNGVLVGNRTAEEISQAATNFNADNDRNGTTPTSPIVSSDGTAIDHAINTDGSADISFEWSYTTSDVATAANNIDGFIVYVRDSASSSSHVLGTSSVEETTYYISAEKRAFILRGTAADRYYTFGVRAYRAVNVDIDSSGYKQSPIIQSSLSAENPYRPSATVAFNGDITGTISGTAAATVVSYATAGNSVATNFNANNDRNATIPTSVTIATNGTAVDHVINTDGSADISFEWSYTTSDVYNAANNIDGFIVYLYSSTSSSSYVINTSPPEETTYYLPRDKRAFILSGAAADRYYTFGVRPYRMVDTDVNSAGIVYGTILQPGGAGENPYRPSATVAFAGNITGTIDGVSATTIVSYANAGNTAATNFNTNNDRNATTPTSPTIASDGTAVDHVINTDGSSDISFEWSYTNSDVYNAANNIDGFIVYVRSSTSSSSYTFGTTPVDETTYYLPRDKRAFILPAVAANRYYNFGVRAYRMVDTDIASAGIVYSAIIQSSGAGENPYRPSANVAFAGDVTGTIDGVSAATVVSYATAGNTAATNFNTNNDRNATIPTSPTVASDGTAVDHVINTDGSSDISFEWSYTTSDVYNAANNIDGFIVYVRSSTSASSYTFGTSPVDETTYYLTREKRAFILPAVAADRYYNFGVRSYRMVDTDVAAAGILYSSIIQSTGSGENPYRPSSTVAFAGNITGTIDGTAVATVVSYATAGNAAATNFNANNDRNGIVPTSPTIFADASAIDHTINTDGSADISFEWSYTTSDVATAANNIDGFIVYVKSSSSSSSYVITGSGLESDVTTYYLPREKRAIILPGVPANRYYTFGVRAYRIVDTDVATPGIIYSPIIQPTYVNGATPSLNENPYLPTANVAFSGDITGTIDGLLASTIKNGINNFNNNNDRISTSPATPTSLTFTSATNLGATTDLTVSWNFTGTGDAYNIDGFIVYLRKTSATNAANILVGDLSNSDIQVAILTQEKRSHTFSGVPSEFFYRAAIRAYRVVDNDIDSAGVKYGTLANSSELASAVPKLGGGSGINVGTSKIYIGAGNYNNADTGFYADGTGQFSLKNKLSWNGTSLTVEGTINATSGTFSGNITAGLTQVGTNLRGVTDYAGIVLRNDSWENGFLRRSDGTVYFRAGGASDKYVYLDTGTVSGSTNMISFPNFKVTYDGNITAAGGTIAGWTINTASISSGGTILNSNGTITVGVTSSTALTLNSGSDITMFSASGGLSSIYFYRDGYSGTNWDTRLEQSAAGNFILYGNTFSLGDYNFGHLPTFIVRTFSYSGGEFRGWDRGVNDETLAVTRAFTTTAGYNTDIGTTTQMLQFFKRNQGNTSVGVGYITARNATTLPAFVAGSDERLKRNIEIFKTDLLDDIKNINTYQWNDIHEVNDDQKTIGFLAKEFYPKYPDIVSGIPGEVDKDGNPVYMQITTANLMPHLFNVVKYLVKKVEDLESKINNV